MLSRSLGLFACLLLIGCSGTWLGTRGRDGAQVLTLGLGGSLTPGLYVRVAAPLFATSIGWMRDGAYVGSDYGYTYLWRQSAHGALIGGELARAECPRQLEDFGYRHDLDAYLDQSHFVVLGVTVTDQRGRVLSTLPLARVEAQLHALFVGAGAGLDLVELFDFLAGWVGFDPMGDDTWEGLRAPFAPEDGESDAA